MASRYLSPTLAKTKNSRTSCAKISVLSSNKARLNAGRMDASRAEMSGAARIESETQRCDLALLLVSRPFLASEFVRQHELPALFRRKRGGEVRIVPIVVGTCAWDVVPELCELQCLPTRDGKVCPLANLPDPDQADTWVDITRRVARAATDRVARRSPTWDTLGLRPNIDRTILRGRDQEMDKLLNAWESDHVRVAAITGPSGAGRPQSSTSSWGG